MPSVCCEVFPTRRSRAGLRYGSSAGWLSASHQYVRFWSTSLPNAVTAALELTPEGRVFLGRLREYLDIWGQRGDRWGWSFPSWIEDPTPVISRLIEYVRQPDRDLQAEFAALVAVREQLVADVRSRVRDQSAEAAQRFEFLLDAAQKAIVLTEDHSHWIDFRCMYHLHRISLELGRPAVDGWADRSTGRRVSAHAARAKGNRCTTTTV